MFGIRRSNSRWQHRADNIVGRTGLIVADFIEVLSLDYPKCDWALDFIFSRWHVRVSGQRARAPVPSYPISDKLVALLQKAKDYKMTREEDIQQRISWAMYLLPADSEVTREIVEAIIRVVQSPAKLGDAAPWTHRYSVLRCPKCGNDLTAESGCCIEGCREGFKPTLAPS